MIEGRILETAALEVWDIGRAVSVESSELSFNPRLLPHKLWGVTRKHVVRGTVPTGGMHHDLSSIPAFK